MKKNRTKFLIILFLFLLFFFSFFFIFKFPRPQLTTHNSQPNITPTPTILREKAYVNYVFDGDTIELQGKITLRLLGIDAPETANKYTKFKEECFAGDSAKIAKELMTGQDIETEKDAEDKDMYGRILRYVWVDDIFVNEFLVRNGYARVEERNKLNLKYQSLLTAAEQEAKKEKRGMWGKCQ